MMSLETAKRVWQARLDPRRQTPSIGLYSHVRDHLGIFYAQLLIFNDQRQAGAAIEGVVRQEELDITQLAVDTQGHTDFAMALAKLLGFDLCPRLKALKDRHLFLPRGTAIPENVRDICSASVDLSRTEAHWEQIVHIVASVHSGHTSAVNVTARFGSASRGDPLYEAVVHLGRRLRTVFLCAYFLNDLFRRELLRVLNRGEAGNALKRAIYTGRVASYQAKQPEQMQAVANALSLLANIVMAWNTGQLQQVLDHWAQRSSAAVPPDLIGRIAPTRTEGINLRGLDNDGRRVVIQPNGGLNLAVLRAAESHEKSGSCEGGSHGAREKHASATVCYCTENEGTPLRQVAGRRFHSPRGTQHPAPALEVHQQRSRWATG